MLKCTCRHVRNCPLTPQRGPDGQYLSPLDGENKPLMRRLRAGEQGAVDGKALPGDFVGTSGDGHVHVVLRAVDGAKAVAYSRALIGRRCKADNAYWCRTHPAPEGVPDVAEAPGGVVGEA